MTEKKYDLDGEECPMGEECAIHFRNDERMLMPEAEYGRIITYVGDYAVITSDNPAILAMVDAMLLPFYETAVLHVGKGAIGDLYELDPEDQLDATRFIQKHDIWDHFEDTHEMVTGMVRADVLDLSKPAVRAPSE